MVDTINLTSSPISRNTLAVGKLCYIPDEEYIWLPGQIIQEVSNSNKTNQEMIIKVRVQLPPDESKKAQKIVFEDRNIDLNSKFIKKILQEQQLLTLPSQNEELGPTGIDDMKAFNYLHEPAILYNLQKRFLAQIPYTYTGDICIAVNPYQWLPELYSQEKQAKYVVRSHSKDIESKESIEPMPPHVYATSNAAYRYMRTYDVNQSVLVSGESGAGKTETTKILMHHFASLAGGLHDTTIKRIVDVSPLLESFGNAKTLRNDNSSRFGKFTLLQFSADSGILVGARCETYLLEKNRVVHHDEKERNFHIFYQILATCEHEQAWGLDKSIRYNYTRDIQNVIIDGIDDTKCFRRTSNALNLIGLEVDQQFIMFRVLAGIIHLGELQLDTQLENEEASKLIQSTSANFVAMLLGLNIEMLETALTTRNITISSEIVAVQLNQSQAFACRDALAKAIYANLFNWLVAKINKSLGKNEEDDRAATTKPTRYIGILDIFGFEHFKYNSFEQFCINYANEKLQQRFTMDVFSIVQQEYEEECIRWSHIDFPDNRDVIALIEDKLGLISLLNDEVMRPKGNDINLVSKLASIHREDNHVIEFPRISKTQFTIKHFAGAVTYEATGFLEKHKDALLTGLSDLMRQSTVPFLAELFEPIDLIPSGVSTPRGRLGSGATFSTSRNRLNPRGSNPRSGAFAVANVGTQFKENLNNLMTRIHATKVHYVRCVKPNQLKSPCFMDLPMVVSQLRCAGVIEAIRISRVAYPNRLPWDTFANKFWVFEPQDYQKTNQASDAETRALELRKLCEHIMSSKGYTSPQQYQIGRTRMYFRFGILENLEDMKIALLQTKAKKLQHVLLGYATHQVYKKKIKAIIKLQSVGRCVIAMGKYHAFLDSVIVIQACWRGRRGRIIAREEKRTQSSILLQKYWRRYSVLKIYRKQRAGAIIIQSYFRMLIERQKFVQKLENQRVQLTMSSTLAALHKARLLAEKNSKIILSSADSNTSSGHDHAKGIVDSSKSFTSDLYKSTNTSKANTDSNPNSVRLREQSSVQWMAGAEGIIHQLQEELDRMRKESESYRETNLSLKSDLEKLKGERDVLAANLHVKTRKYEKELKYEKERNEQLQKELRKFQYMDQSSNSKKEVAETDRQSRTFHRSVSRAKAGGAYRTLGAKKSGRGGIVAGKNPLDRISSARQSSTAATGERETLALKSADTNNFLRVSAQKLSLVNLFGRQSTGSMDQNDQESIESSLRASHNQDQLSRRSLVETMNTGMASLKERLSSVKLKYGEGGSVNAIYYPNNLNTAQSLRLPIENHSSVQNFRSSTFNNMPNASRASTLRASSSIDPTMYSKRGSSVTTSTIGFPNILDQETESLLHEHLPPGWEARLSRSKGKVYYCHPSRRLTQWDKPNWSADHRFSPDGNDDIAMSSSINSPSINDMGW